MTVLRMCKCGLFVKQTPCSKCRRQDEKRRGTTTQRGLGSDHQHIRRQVLLEERYCWICGRPGTQTDPLTADHVTPRSKGGTNVRQNYRAAHASCNYSRGAA